MQSQLSKMNDLGRPKSLEFLTAFNTVGTETNLMGWLGVRIYFA